VVKPFRLLAAALLLAATPGLGQGFELDLSQPDAKAVKPILVLPPVTKVTTTTGFAGLETRRTTEKFDTAVHQRLVQAFQRELGAGVLDADAVLGLLKRQGVTAVKLSAPAAANLGAVAKASWVVRFEYTRPTLTATLFDATGTQAGEVLTFDAAQGVTSALASRVALRVHAQMGGAAPEAPGEPALGLDISSPPPPAPPPPEEISDPDLQVRAPPPPPAARLADPSRERVVLLVAFGGVTRGLDSSGTGAATLTSLAANAQPALGGYLRLLPLQWFAATQARPWSDLELELHYRRSLSGPVAVQGGSATCQVIDDDLQGRATWRYHLQGGPWMPSLGAAVGLAQEQTSAEAACGAQVPSLTYRGLDLQLRYRQPLGGDLFSLDLAVGPRILFAGAQAPKPGFSFSGELWLEAKPWSVLFARAGVRVSRLALANDTLGFTDLRTFFGLEAGAFF
jgi:hypothetical protein